MRAKVIERRSFAKINLCLELLGERADGYVEIRTIFQTIALADRIVFEEAPAGVLEVLCDDPSIPSGEGNLVWRAARLLLAETGVAKGARVRLSKVIPSGAGLGGGSGNGAVALVTLNRMWGLGLDGERLHRLAAGLGSDVPFFLYGGTALGLGRGEEVYPLPDFPACGVVVALPPFRIATPDVYRAARPLLTPRSGGHTIWRFAPGSVAGGVDYSCVINELEPAAAQGHPALTLIRRRLVELGAAASALCGSGSAVFGLFPGEAEGAAYALAGEDPGLTVFPTRTLDGRLYREAIYGGS